MGNLDKRAPYLPDYWTLQDNLRFSDFRPALRRILLEAQTPLTVGVFGPWGSGKTSLLRMLWMDIEEMGLPSIRTVWFTAWKYDRHEALWRAFILRVLDGLYPRKSGEGPREARARIPPEELTDPQQKEQVDHLDRLVRSVYGAVEWEELGRWVFEWSKAGKELAKLPAFLILLAAGAEKAAEALGIAPDLAELVQREAQAHRLEHLASMEQFEEAFRNVLRLVLGAEGRLIVFVDDLDRCLPEKAVEVLEAIKLFLETPGTVFALGMDQEVVKRGIEARYAAFFRPAKGEEREELPISGDAYLQKIVQIPFFLPPLVESDMESFIHSQEEGTSDDARLTETTRAVFAHGVLPNPRQAKRALNIFHLLREVALAREGRPRDQGGIPSGGVSWPLLAKTVLIQTQWPELYREWRQVHTLVRTLEEEYARRPSTEDEALRGLTARPIAAEDGEPQIGGMLGPFLTDRRRYALLERMLAFPPPDAAGEGRDRARFTGLDRDQMSVYVRLAGAMEEPRAIEEAPVILLSEILSGDPARVQEAVARLDQQEAEPDGPLHRALAEQLHHALSDPAQTTRARVGAGDALGLIGDPRFRRDAWYLPDEPLLGFVEIPEGPFLMGSDPKKDKGAVEHEQPQHEVRLARFYIARYPVTVAQFRAFVEAGGRKLEDPHSLRRIANHPVVWVTWNEAQAYCDWLSERLRAWEGTPEPLAGLLRNEEWRVTLPSEAEWEKAARGTDGRIYPRGDEPDPDRANYAETGIGTTSAVGCFPGGSSPYGAEDMTGNVWEWTRSPFRPYPYVPSDDREDPQAAGPRVLRGGAFSSGAGNMRCAYRFRNSPIYFVRFGSFGFRVVVSPSDSGR